MGSEFRLGQDVAITCSGEWGRVIGIADYENSESQCLVRYKAADGRAVESWWAFSALSQA